MMRKYIFLIALTIASSNSIMAQSKSFILNLQTGQQQVTTDKLIDYIQKNDDSSYAIVYLPSTQQASKKSILICPGGGYAIVAIKHEGTEWAEYLQKLGIASVVLKYRMPKGNYMLPIEDAEHTLSFMRSNAQTWGINADSIGIMGFSAGGHLASTIATHVNAQLKPAFQILFYPVITMLPEIAHSGSHNNLLGKNPPKSLEELYSNNLQVTDSTPKAFISLSSDDKTVAPVNSISYYNALLQHKVSASLHIYPVGGHGWGFRSSFPYHSLVIEELKAWLGSF